MERKGFVFYRSFATALLRLEPEPLKAALKRICDYALDGIDNPGDGITELVFELVKPQIDANNKRYENGKKGGKPKSNQTITKAEPNYNQTITKAEPNYNQTITKAEPKEKDKEKDKVKEKEKDKDNVETFGLFDDGVFHIGDFFKEQKN